MAFWSSETVKRRVPDQGLIDPYDQLRVMRGAYELSVGPEAYITSTTGEKTKLEDGDRIIIPPGQFGLLVTAEVVSVPNDAMAFLSIKSTTKLQGLVNVSGFHVDPGYKNTLKFAVYNAGPQSIYLDQGQPTFLIWFAALDQATEDLYTPRPGLSKNITAEDVKRIAGDVASPAELKKQIDEIKNDYDKRLQSVELSEKILRWLVGSLLVLILGTMLRAGWFDRVIEHGGRSSSPQSKQAAPAQAKDDKGVAGAPQPAATAVEQPHDDIKEIVRYGVNSLGLWLLGGTGIISGAVLVSAWIIKGQMKKQP